MYARPLLAVALFAASAASHALEVTACASDTQGPGTTLKGAIAAGGSVTFRCPPGTRLLVTDSHAVGRDTLIDGGGTITLVVRLTAAPAFAVGTGQRLTLARLHLEGERRVPGGRTPGIATVVVGGTGTAVWREVTARRLDRPLFVLQNGRAIIDNSTLTDGPDPLRVTGGGQLEIRGGRIERLPLALFADGGRVTIHGTRFSGSRLVLSGCQFEIADAAFHDHDARAANVNGGALDTDCSGRVTRTLFQNNRAVNGGAVHLRSLTRGIEFQRVRFIANQATANGGAIHRERYLLVANAPNPPVRLRYSVFRNNSAGGDGGAVSIGSGRVEAQATHFAGNAAGRDGGAVNSRALRASRATFIRNRAGQAGGALHLYVASHPHPGLTTSILANALIVQNEAPRGAGVYGSALRIVNSTLADNRGAALDAGTSTVRPAITLANTLIASNDTECTASPGSGFAVQGPNLQFPGSTCPGVPVADPHLDPVYAPVVGSPALAAADLRTCLEAPVDGRDALGEPRPQGRGCTIGAIEGAVERQVWDRLVNSRGEVPVELVQRIVELGRRLLR